MRAPQLQHQHKRAADKLAEQMDGKLAVAPQDAAAGSKPAKSPAPKAASASPPPATAPDATQGAGGAAATPAGQRKGAGGRRGEPCSPASSRLATEGARWQD